MKMKTTAGDFIGSKCKYIKTLHILLLSIMISLFGCGSDSSPQQPDTQVHIKRGKAYQKQGQYRAAIIEARNAIQQKPDDIAAHILLASIYNELGQSKVAIDQLIPFKGNTEADYLLTLINAYLQKSKYQSAQNLLSENHQLSKSHYERYTLYLANAYAGQGEKDEAQKAYTDIIEKNPRFIEALLGLARLYSSTGEYDNAKEIIEQILQKDTSNPDALILKARIALKSDDFETAETLLTDALTSMPTTDLVTPQRANTLRALSEILTRQGRSAEAMVYSRILADAFPGAQEIESRLSEALALYKDGDLAQSEKILQEVLAQAPGHELTGTLLGVINYLQGDVADAQRYFTEHMDEETATPVAKQAFALTQFRLNQPQKVLELLQSEAENSDNPDTLSLYGIAALSSDNPEKGVTALQKALQLSPEKARLHLVLARYFNSASTPQPKRALAQIQEAFQHSPEDPYVQSALAQQFLFMKREKEATSHINNVVKRFGDQASSQHLAGTYFLSQKKTRLAQKHFKNAYKADANYINAYFGYAEAAITLKDWESALSHYEKVLAVKSDQIMPFINAYKGIITTYELQQQSEKGISRLEKLAQQSGDNTIPYAVLAEYYTRKLDLTAALDYFSKIQNKETDYILNLGGAIHFEKGRQALLEKNYSTARQALVTALEFMPNNLRALSLLTNIEIEAQQYAEASKIIAQVRNLNANALANALNGDLEQAQGNSDESIAWFKKSWEEQPNDLLAVKLYTALSKLSFEKSNTFLNDWQKKLPNSLRAKTAQATQLQSQGKLQESVIIYEDILKQAPDSAVTLNNLAWSYGELGDKRAIETARKAYELAPQIASIIDTYGWLLVENNQTREGIKLLEEAVKIEPQNKEIAKHLEKAKSKLQ